MKKPAILLLTTLLSSSLVVSANNEANSTRLVLNKVERVNPQMLTNPFHFIQKESVKKERVMALSVEEPIVPEVSPVVQATPTPSTPTPVPTQAPKVEPTPTPKATPKPVPPKPSPTASVKAVQPVATAKPKPTSTPSPTPSPTTEKEKFSDSDKELLAKLVTAESTGQPHAGQVAVAAVVLNRIAHPAWPHTVRGVVYQPRQFSPVSNGAINKQPTAEARQAVQEAINGSDPSHGAIYFANLGIADHMPNPNAKITVKIGAHTFYK